MFDELAPSRPTPEVEGEIPRRLASVIDGLVNARRNLDYMTAGAVPEVAVEPRTVFDCVLLLEEIALSISDQAARLRTQVGRVS